METAIVFQRHSIHLDPRTKFLLLFTVGGVIFANISRETEIIIFSVLSILTIFEHQYRTFLRFGSVFAIMMLVDIFVAPHLSGALGAAVLTLVRIPRLLIPICLSSTLLIRTTTVSEFIAAFQKIHVSEKLIIPFSVMFRFIPTVKEEWCSISNAMRFRGIGVSALNMLTRPMETLEYVMVPLLMSTATISGELAAASLSRGLDSDIRRSCITQVKLGLADYIVILGAVVLVAETVVR
ncbi:energy-coupling factor transport system permease protein [Kineothrix alysoides]|uniref:Energy-coupling factor transport system permease protein n=1 Tax=Kineothrix alysoides TaxID=1469948 RepID=A0A4R1QX82_9FIRM|nr:energy-coupling factor transporter transmembrane component T [Kineothrix alysoides]TCL55380.1 energy-coupling factor transport system permease protein [Kineothrix alysoides]